MDEFKQYIVSKFPNRSPKILFQLERVNHSEYKFMVPEVQLMWELWQSRRAEVDERDKQIEESLQKVVRIKESFNQGKIVNYVMFLDDLEKILRGTSDINLPR